MCQSYQINTQWTPKSIWNVWAKLLATWAKECCDVLLISLHQSSKDKIKEYNWFVLQTRKHLSNIPCYLFMIFLQSRWVYFNQSPRFASSSRSCLRGSELGLGLRQIAHNIVKQIIVIEYRPAIGRRYSLFVHKMGVGLYWSSKIFLILSSIIILQFAVVLAVSNMIWVRTSSCCEFKLVVMGTICIL